MKPPKFSPSHEGFPMILNVCDRRQHGLIDLNMTNKQNKPPSLLERLLFNPTFQVLSI
jgi:hypothetical protein